MNALVQVPSYEMSPLAVATHRLYQAFVGVRQAQPALGLKGWSRLLSCSEGELQASRLGQEAVMPLVDVFSLLYQLAGLGEVEISSFNAAGWARYTGRLAPPDLCLDDPGHLSLQLRSSHQCLQLHMDAFYWGCAVEDQPPEATIQQSLQFFNKAGERFLKVKATQATSQSGWQSLLERFARSEQPGQPLFAVEPEQKNVSAPANLAAFSQEWRLMEAPGQVAQLLKRYQADYLSCLQHLDQKFAREVSLNALFDLLKVVNQLPEADCKPVLEMSFLTAGCLQRVSGVLQPPRLQHKALCIAYAEGCLHLDPQLLEEAWVVRKPQGDGWVTTLEIFDHQGQLLLQLQEKKPSAQPENLLLRQIFQTLS